MQLAGTLFSYICGTECPGDVIWKPKPVSSVPEDNIRFMSQCPVNTYNETEEERSGSTPVQFSYISLCYLELVPLLLLSASSPLLLTPPVF